MCGASQVGGTPATGQLGGGHIQPVAFDFTQATHPENRCRFDPGTPVGSLQASGRNAVAGEWGVRRLTPREWERLQGFPDDWTLVPWRKGLAPKTRRYKAIGNSMAVPVMRYIGKRIRNIQRTTP